MWTWPINNYSAAYEYIHNKMKQLDLVKDAHKHTCRLARITKYHNLLCGSSLHAPALV
ncbi:hypothetical protein PVA17_12140 [Lysinibacillus sp. CNPSo 3705]|uniref:hypothetical protein n=1 Tax=Lysinibacillus sp. CNPSo 3705 TaxID=3028148 RepID=UPI0023641341|nr:hypothetical protein [Lysinibacillus sp. CNPSo 3705]MDD1503507.1 hypothetical protein [Lysinibacillus sp. CNPSo 3705]